MIFLDQPHNTHHKLFEVTDRKVLQNLERRSNNINWPKTTNSPAWAAFDEEVTNIVKFFMYGTIEQKIEKYDKYVYAVAVEHFGVKAVSDFSTRLNQVRRRKRRLQDLRRRQRELRNHYRKATDDQKEGKDALQKQLHEQILDLRRSQVRKHIYLHCGR